MRPVQQVGIADAVSLTNVVIGFLGIVTAIHSPVLAARLLLLAAIADAIDGVVARTVGGSPVGELLDSIADVVSFGVGPAVLLWGITRNTWQIASVDASIRTAVALGIPAVYVMSSVLRTAAYITLDARGEPRRGMPNTLATVVLTGAYLAGIDAVGILLSATLPLIALKLSSVQYPALYRRDMLIVGAVQLGAVIIPTAAARTFPRLLLIAALLFLMFGPKYYSGRDGSV